MEDLPRARDRHAGVPSLAWPSLAVGRMLAISNTSDITDAHVAITAMSRDHAIATSDPGDLAKLAPNCELLQV